MAENNPNNSLIVPYNDLYPYNSQGEKTFISENVYDQEEDKKSESN